MMNEVQDELKYLTSFDNNIQAHLFSRYLAEFNIESFVFDENIVMINPLFNNLIGGVKIKVASSDFERASELLKNYDISPIINNQNSIVLCPRCGSSKIETNFKAVYSLKSKLALLLALLTSTYPIHTDSIYYCKDCKNSFEVN